MKTTKKEIDVYVCEICGLELSSMGAHFVAKDDKKEQYRFLHIMVEDDKKEQYYFHKECVDKLLIEKAKNLWKKS